MGNPITEWPTAPMAILITGACAAGKSTVAELLTERFERAVHVRGDGFRRMIVRGRVDAGYCDRAEAERQRALRHRLMVETVDAFVEAGFVAVAQDVMLGAELQAVLDRVQTRPLYLVVLAPPVEVLHAREAIREKEAYDEVITPELLDRALREETARLGLWLDTSGHTPAQTADEILARLDEGLILPAG